MTRVKTKHPIAILIILTIFYGVEVNATSWLVNCKDDEIAVADGINTMESPPVCKKLVVVKKEYEDKCSTGELYGCMRRWDISHRFGAEDQALWHKRYIEKSKEFCHKGSADACQEVWRVIGNETYPKRLSSETVQKYHQGKRSRTDEERELMIKYIGLACEKAKPQNHPSMDYFCDMFNNSKYY